MPEIRTVRPGWIVGLALCLILPVAASAQGTADPSVRLDRVQAALDSGDVEAARAALESWFEADREDTPEGVVDRARFLRARLATDADEAASTYRRLALEAGSEYAPMARLRLGQLRLAAGRPDGAVRDLELLRADFPGHPLVAESWFWTGLARRVSGRHDDACRALRRAVDAAEASNRTGLLARARQEAALCDRDGDGPVWAVQVGAFSTREAARDQLERLGRTGREGRLVTGEDGLVRVRAGRFAREADAEELADRLRASGFDAVIVNEDGTGSQR